MPNVIKSATTISAGTIKKNNFVIGINTSMGYGPTSTTNFWNGIVPPYSGYTVYEQKSSQGPSIRTASDDSELITIAKQYGGTNINTVNDALSYLNGQSNYLVANIDYPSIVTDGLIVNLDAGYVPSYPRTGTVWSDLSGNNNHGTLVNSPTYSSDNGGSIIFDGVDDACNIPIPNASSYSTITICGFIKWLSFGSDMFLGMTTYDVWTAGNCLGYNNGNGNVIGIDAATVTSLGLLGEWKHYTFVMNSSGLLSTNKIYINGVSVGPLTAVVGGDSGAPGFATNLKLCDWNNGGYYANLQYGNVMTYSRELTPSEILQNFNATKGRYLNFIPNGDFKLGNYNFVNSGGIANSSVTLPGSSYSLQMPQQQYTTFLSDNLFEVDTSKNYKYTVWTRTLTKGGPNNDVLSGGHMGYMTFDSSYRFIDLRMCGGVANTVLTRDLNPGDTYAYVSNQNNQWVGPNTEYYFRHFMIYPPSHPEFSQKWKYTRIGYGDVDIYYNEITDIGGGELRLRFADSNNNWVTFPNIGYPTPAGTGVMNGVAGGTYSYVFYPTTGAYGEWSKYESSIFTGEDRNSGIPFRYGTKYILFMHLINYAIPAGTTPLPIMLIGKVLFEQI
jgi:hypothetical protein